MVNRLAFEQPLYGRGRFLESLIALPFVRPGLARHALVNQLAGSEREPETPREHDRQRRRTLGDDRWVVALPRGTHCPKGQLRPCHRGAEPAPDESGLT